MIYRFIFKETDMLNNIDNKDALDRFATIWDHVECGIAIIDAETREIIDINPVAARMFGDNKEKIIGKRCHKFVCPAEVNSCPIMDKGMVVDRSERIFINAKGETIPIIKSVAKIRYNNRLALLESFTDISNLKEAEEKLRFLHITEQANQAKSDFLSRMSHEIRTPMNAIIGMTKIAEKTSDIDKLKHCIDTIGLSSEHLLSIINDILDMSKIEAGKLELYSDDFQMEKMLMRICNLFHEKMEMKKIDFNIDIDEKISDSYNGDELRISQIITNLVSNAVKFTQNGGNISLSVKQKAPDTVQFVVSDDGIGMTEEQQVRLFNAFEQADTSISRRFGGTGLGLAICKNLAEKMGGCISAISAPDKGATFTVDINLAPACDNIISTNIPTDTKLLIAVDKTESIKLFEKIKSKYSLDMTICTNAGDAIKAAENAVLNGRKYNAALLATSLSDMDVFELAQSIKCFVEPSSIIALSSFLQWDKIDEQMHLFGIHKFIPTPLFATGILYAINDVINDNVETNAKSNISIENTPDFSQIHLLLVEDIEINREIFIELLAPTKISIDVAENGIEAVRMFKNDPDKYNMIIMDVQMPLMNGYEATSIIRSLEHRSAQTIPIVAMSANVFKEDIEKCHSCGMNDHIAKPIDINIVIEKIQTYNTV